MRTPTVYSLQASLAVLMLQLGSSASGFEIPTGNDELKLKWDNTLKYSNAVRTSNPSATLTQPSANSNNVNLDDGDRNFKKGLISNRLDLLSELDAAYKGFGLRLTGAAWYDDVYNKNNDNPGFAGGAFPNQRSVASDQFVEQTRKVHGRNAELLDAFVYGGFNLGQTQRLSFRLGRHGMVWGETFFFGANGIAGGMMPVDVVKLVSVPNTQFKEAIRPVPMISGQFQITQETSVGAYYQFRWAKSRIPTVGSYFSPADTTPDGSEQLLLAGAGSPFLANAQRQADAQPKNSGQGGLQLRSRFDQTDVGVYLIRYHEKTPQPVVSIGAAPVTFVPGPGCVIPGSFPTGPASCALPAPVGFRNVYGENVTSWGFSASQTFDTVNLASEISFRQNQPLSSGRTADISALTRGRLSDNSGNPAYPVGRTAHINISAIWSIEPNALFREGSLVGEIGWNRVLKVTRNAQDVDPNASRDAVAVRGLFQTVHRQVTPGLDLSPRIGLGWAPKGSRSSITPTSLPQNGTGDLTLGVEATYEDAWRANLSFTHYIGSEGSFLIPAGGGANSLGFKQYYGDRDFIAFSLRRSF